MAEGGQSQLNRRSTRSSSIQAPKATSAFGHVSAWLGFNRKNKLFALEKQSPLGAYLSAAELNRLARLCTIVRFSKGRTIRADSPFYLVLEGAVAVMDDDEATELTQRKQGSFFTRHAGRGGSTYASKGSGSSLSTSVSASEPQLQEALLVAKSAGSVLLAPADAVKLQACNNCPDQIRPDQIRPDQIRPEQKRPLPSASGDPAA